MNGEHGKTAQYYMIYVNLVKYYLLFNSSIRTADFSLFKYILPKISNLFFAVNQPNYARWLVRYHNNLCKVDETHPGLRNSFEKGSFGVKRTDKDFSRQPIDLTLEQTINLDAANKLTGVLHFTNSDAARQKWCKSHSIRSTVISHVMQKAGLSRNQDIIADLEKSKMNKSIKHMNNFIDGILRNINPFDEDIDKNMLFNISNGQAASTAIEGFLLKVEDSGNKLRESFIRECEEDANRFEKPIKRNKILTFTETLKKKKVYLNGKVQEIRMQRDLFGRLLAVSLDQQIDLEKVLSYPLTPVALSLCHLDGNMCKTDKSALLKCLVNGTNDADNALPSRIDVTVIDGFFFLHLLTNIPLTFGNISKQILQAVIRQPGRNVSIVFDKYQSPSIKDSEHALRDTSEKRDYHITGDEQKRPADFSKELKNIKFKEALVRYLIQDWEKAEMAPFFGTKTVYLNFDYCYKYTVENGRIMKSIEDVFSCPSHEEADTKIVQHICNLNYDATVSIKCSDTDILVILLGNMSNLKSDMKIWLELGVGNCLRYVNVTEIHRRLGQSICAALPALHAFTGCDQNPAFFRKGKKRPYKMLTHSNDFQKAFTNLSALNDDNRANVMEKMEEFVCQLYGQKKIKNLHEARLAIFSKSYTFKDTEDTFKIHTKNYDASNLPPCRAELVKQVHRTAYISSIWANAHLKIPTTKLAVEYGWQESEGRFEFEWYEGQQIPTFVKDVVIQPNDESDAESELTDERDIEVNESDRSDSSSDSE